MADPNNRAEFEHRSRLFSDAVMKQVHSLVPRDWQMAMLQLDVAFSSATGVRSIKHRLWNPLTDAEVCDFPEALFRASTALHTVCAEYQQAWTRCLALYERNARIEFEYAMYYHHR